MATLKQLKLQLAKKKEKSANLAATLKILKDEIKLLAEQVKTFIVQEPIAKKKAAVSKKKK